MTWSTLETAVDALQTAVGGITGVNFAPDNPPEQPGDYPFVVTYTRGGTLRFNTAEDYRGLHDIVIELHIARQDLPEDVATLLPFYELVSKKIFTTLRDNSAAYEDVPYTFGGLGWGIDEAGQPVVKTIGFTWTIRALKIITTL